MKENIKKIERMLKEYNSNEIEIRNIELELEELNNISISSINSEGEKTSKTNKIQYTVEQQLIQKEEKTKKLLNIKNQLNLINRKIDNTLDGLKPKEKQVIELRYIELVGYSWGNIARKMDISEAWARGLKSKGIKKMAHIMFRHS
ncbi:sigma factor-like helix-turn-helix DNA-binding protein [Clostridium senegalense]|uniref:sigma factor-like helix-turn-helix DNA-binding protein n=1 Tax=Clostridium senegalense TaxID=1465809 RepID=UPI000287E679|nr:sigma factor-like helix-turn-helix DNA-binding protein [Clostridium senegalense]